MATGRKEAMGGDGATGRHHAMTVAPVAGRRAGSVPEPGALLAVGLMTGTSMDGIDAALVRTDGRSVRPVGTAQTMALPSLLRRRLLAVAAAPLARHADADIDDLAQALEAAHVEAVASVLAANDLAPAAVDVVGFHGQTLYHAPTPGRAGTGRTWQLGDGARLAARLGRPVAWDFRSADVAAGGEGAPFAPVFHAAVASAAGLDLPAAVLNIGGVANLTLITAAAAPDRPDAPGLLAFDTGPGNALIDDWVGRHGLGRCDVDGRLAAQGRVDPAALARLLDHPFFDRVPPKSLDRFAFSANPVAGLAAADGAATLAAFTVATVARAVDHLAVRPRVLLVCGGGRHNPVLMAGLAEALAMPVAPIDTIGFDGDGLEAQAFGYLAVRVWHGRPLSFPGTTGVPRPLPGGRISWPSA